MTEWRALLHIITLLRAEREARREVLSQIADKSEYERPDTTRHDTTRPRDAFGELLSLQLRV